jgi:hypothetical protein
MPLTELTSTGVNFLKKTGSGSDGIGLFSNVQFYQKQLGSQGAGNLIFTLSSPYQVGSNSLWVFVNGQKAELDSTPIGQLQYAETSAQTVQFGAALLSTDVIEFAVLGSYEIADMTQLFMPPGFVFPVVHSNAVPVGTLECNGAWVSQTTYSALYTGFPLSIGGQYGTSGGNFRLPDYRGRFLRGWSHGTGRDPDAASRISSPAGSPSGDNVGSYQADEFRSHRHAPQPGFANFFSTSGNNVGDPGDNYGAFANTAYAGGNETRPINTYVMWVIKY